MKDHKLTFRNAVLAAIAVLFPALTPSYAESTFSEVWHATQDGAYSQLPEHRTTNASFFRGSVNLLASSAKRTVNDHRDILPAFQKLVHPIGICFSGTWNIDRNTPYTGYFAKDARGLIVMRASEAVGQGKRGDYRAFGLAGKIFPTTNPNNLTAYQTANFFTVDDLGGTMAKSFLELGKTNEPALSLHLNSVFVLPMIMSIQKAFSAADSNPLYRPLYQIAELGLRPGAAGKAPHWIKLVSESVPKESAIPADFRDELRLNRFQNQTLKFGILVSEAGRPHWVRIGSIELTDEALSEGCDHRLHFNHPKIRN